MRASSGSQDNETVTTPKFGEYHADPNSNPYKVELHRHLRAYAVLRGTVFLSGDSYPHVNYDIDQFGLPHHRIQIRSRYSYL